MIPEARFFPAVFVAVLAVSLSTSVKGTSCTKTGRDNPQDRNGTIKLKAGVIFKSGDVKPVARTDFFVLSKDLDLISEEAAKNLNLPLGVPFEQYLDNLAYGSAELKAWIKKHDIRRFMISSGNEDVKQSLYSSIFNRRDFLDVPEFLDWLRSNPPNRNGVTGGLPKYPVSTGDRAKDDKAMQKYREAVFDRTINVEFYGLPKVSRWVVSMMDDLLKGREWLSYTDEMIRRRERIADEAPIIAQKYTVKVVKTSLSGEAEIALPPGTYWLSNLLPTSVGQSSVLWNTKLVVETGKTLIIELSNDNAKEIK